MASIWLPWTDAPDALNAGTGGGAIFLACLIALQFILVPRQRPIVPIMMLGLYLILLGLMALARDEPSLRRALGLTDLLILFLVSGRVAFVLVFHGLLHFLHRDLPKIALDILQTLVYLLAIVLTLTAAGVEPLSLLTGSAVVTAVLGLALRDTLGNLFAGIAIQAQRPFEIGDWIQFDDNQAHIGRVVEVNWRATKVITLDLVEVVVPNGTLGMGRITNFTKPLPLSRRSIYVHAAYDVPPQRVHEVILVAIANAWGVLKEPPPSVVTHAFDERGVQYWVRFFTIEFGTRDRVDGGVRDCVWYALNRAGMSIPGPLRTITLRRNETTAVAGEAPADRRERALRSLPLFAELLDDDVRRLADLSQTRLFAPHEVVVREGDPAHEMFVVLRGRLTVSVHRPDVNTVGVSEIGPNEIFGEMALLTGANRSATVRADEECELLVIAADTFRGLLAASPDLAERVHALSRARKANLDDRVGEATRPVEPAVERHFLVRFLEQLLGG
jgi:small-conductance mechanosensitive channel/CRP-like cAMP-binding protein